MKNILSFYRRNFQAVISIACFIMLLISACSSKKEEAVSEASEENHSSESIHLSEEQVKAIGYCYGYGGISKPNDFSKSEWKANAAPQNRATVSVLMVEL
jgi:hypothetical protein